jgi:hypothetical protein
MNTFNMTCEAVEATLPDYLDETLEAWVRTPVEEHLGQCLRCAGLVRDLRNIEKEAAALPDLVPVRDLWPEIEARIGTPVVAVTPRAVAVPDSIPDTGPSAGATEVTPIRARMFPAWMGAAAAALVVLTAGTTYLLTSRAVRQPDAQYTASTGPIESAPVVVEPEGGGDSSGATVVSGGPDSTEPASAGARPRTPAIGGTPTARLARSATEAVYDKEIASLQAIMSWRRAELDPATAAIIDRNLRIIDAAIAQSKAALRRDPASSMLGDQLTHALDKKVELLRTAAMLPSST